MRLDFLILILDSVSEQVVNNSGSLDFSQDYTEK